MKKYLCLLVGVALFAACAPEHETKTAETEVMPVATTTDPESSPITLSTSGSTLFDLISRPKIRIQATSGDTFGLHPNVTPVILEPPLEETLAPATIAFNTPQMKTRASRAVLIDAAGVETRTKLTNLGSFRIAGVNVRAPDLRLGKFAFYDSSRGKVIGLLGMDILGTNGTIIDFGQKKLYFYPL